jgi:hypothetical protein
VGTDKNDKSKNVGGWQSSADHLKADPSTLRGYGSNIAQLRFDLQLDVIGAGTNGVGKDQSISTAMFEPGQTCNELADDNGQEFLSALNDFVVRFTAIASGSLTMADLFEGVVARGKAMFAAQANAMEWAFAMPGAHKPSNVPSYIKGTILEETAKHAGGGADSTEDKLLQAGHYSGADVAVYSTAGGGKRYVLHTPDGGYAEWGEDAKGHRTYQTTRQGDGPTVTTTYSDKGKVTGVSKRYSPTSSPLPVVFKEKDIVSVVDEQQRVENIDEDGKKTTTVSHTVVTKYSDDTETHTYYTDKNGTKTDEVTVNRQPPAATPETWSDLANKQSVAMMAKAKGL